MRHVIVYLPESLFGRVALLYLPPPLPAAASLSSLLLQPRTFRFTSLDVFLTSHSASLHIRRLRLLQRYTFCNQLRLFDNQLLSPASSTQASDQDCFQTLHHDCTASASAPALFIR